MEYRLGTGLLSAAFAMLTLAYAGNCPAVNVADFVKDDNFREIKLSPDGKYLAATVPLEDTTALVILRRSDNSLSGTFRLGDHGDIAGFWWVNPTRVLIGSAKKIGDLAAPQLTGELYAMNADGSHTDLLVGQSLVGRGAGTKIQPKKVERVAAFLIDRLPDNDNNVLISVSPFDGDPYTRVDRMDVNSGRRATVARAPVRNARFVTDNRGIVRYALGSNTDNVSKLYYRSDEDADWTLANDENVTDRIEVPVGFSADDATAYLISQQASGPDVIVQVQVASGERKVLVQDDDSDTLPDRIMYSANTAIPVGVQLMDGKPRTVFFDETSTDARLYRSLEVAFPGQTPVITSTTADGKFALVATSSDRNPGDFYVFDVEGKKAEHLLSRAAWLDPEAMGAVRPIAFDARDGKKLKGYLTTPKGSNGKDLPMVVLPHGGPYGIYETWGFNIERQMLASAGYAVLQVDFRGSGNHGRAFMQAGAREWGGTMQDDVTDATRWAIQQGVADPKRICIYGASYGAYAALMGVAKEPALYRCAAGYVGVYNLPVMYNEGDTQRLGSGKTFLREWLGEKDTLAEHSPTQLADRIKVPVFLAAGGEDERAPIVHSKMMERALRTAGVPVETLYYDDEGHGFYVRAHREAFYTQLLSFLAKNIGGAPPSAVAGLN